MPLFQYLRGVKSVAATDPAPSRTVQFQMGGKPYTPASRSASDLEGTIAHRYEQIVWTFGAVRAISSNAARLKIVCRAGDPENGPEIDHPLLARLNYKPNDAEPAAFFRHRLSAQRLLSSRGAFVEVVRSRGGDILGLYLLPPHRTRPIPSSTPGQLVDGYELKVGTETVELDPDRVLWFRNPHPLDPYRSMTPLEAAAVAIDTDWLAALYNNTFLKNDGRPGGIISVKGNLLPDDADELKSYFRGGASRAGEWRLIEAEDIGVNDLSVNPRDAAWLEARAAAKVEILDAFGLGETLLGNASGRTFANADTEKEVFWEETEVPHCEAETDVWDMVDDDPNTFLRHDYSTVPALQRAKQARDAELREEFDRGLISVDEYRQATGRTAIGLASTQALLVGFSVTPLPGTDGAVATDPRVDSGGTGKQAKEAVPAGDSAHVASDAAPFLRDKAVGAVELFHTKWEATVASEMRMYFRRQEAAIISKIKSAKVRHGTRHWEGPAHTEKAIILGDIYDQGKWDRELASVAEGFITAMVDAAGKRAVKDSGVNDVRKAVAVSFDVHDPRVTTAIKKRTAHIVNANGTTKEAIRATLAAGDKAGETIPQLAARVSEVFSVASNSRATMIARTEVGSAHNVGLLEGARQTGLVATKEWIAIGDHRSRPSHVEVDGTKIGLNELFNVDGEDMDGPGDGNASAENTINCRCSLLFDFG